MAKKSRRKKLHKQKIRHVVTPDSTSCKLGFDYGISVRAAAVGSIDFNQNLIEAQIVAVAYGADFSQELGQRVPVISLVGRNEKPLRKAFEEFSRWAEFSDPDAAEVTLVFGKKDGFKLIINPDPEVLVNRVLRYDTVSDPIAFQISWIKSIDTTSKALKELRSHLERGIRPYLLAAATYIGITPDRSPSPDLIRPIPGVKQLLKFRIRFVDEDSETDKHWQQIARMKKNKRPAKEKEFPHIKSPAQIMDSRINRLKVLFPVTLWRAGNIESLRSTCLAAKELGLGQWQVEQALCNAVLSREINQGQPYFTGVTAEEWPKRLLDRLGERYEIADGQTEIVPPVTAGEIVHQAVLDSGFLLRGIGLQQVPKTLDAVQGELSRRDLLEVPAKYDICAD